MKFCVTYSHYIIYCFLYFHLNVLSSYFGQIQPVISCIDRLHLTKPYAVVRLDRVNGIGKDEDRAPYKQVMSRRQMLRDTDLSPRDLRRIDPVLTQSNNTPAIIVREDCYYSRRLYYIIVREDYIIVREDYVIVREDYIIVCEDNVIVSEGNIQI